MIQFLKLSSHGAQQEQYSRFHFSLSYYYFIIENVIVTQFISPPTNYHHQILCKFPFFSPQYNIICLFYK